MSQPDPNLSHARADVARFVEHLGHMPYVGRVFIVGSRSPASERTARPDSDWDLMPERLGPGFIPRPRRTPWFLLADIFGWSDTRADAVEVWPTDPTGVLTT